MVKSIPNLFTAKSSFAKSFLTCDEPNSPVPSLSTQVSRFESIADAVFVLFAWLKQISHLSVGVNLASATLLPSYMPSLTRLQ